MGDSFYRVVFEGMSDDYYFHTHEDAATFLLESYFDDFDVESEEEVIAINNQVADTDGIESYGWIDELWFEK